MPLGLAFNIKYSTKLKLKIRWQIRLPSFITLSSFPGPVWIQLTGQALVILPLIKSHVKNTMTCRPSKDDRLESDGITYEAFWFLQYLQLTTIFAIIIGVFRKVTKILRLSYMQYLQFERSQNLVLYHILTERSWLLHFWSHLPG